MKKLIIIAIALVCSCKRSDKPQVHEQPTAEASVGVSDSIQANIDDYFDINTELVDGWLKIGTVATEVTDSLGHHETGPGEVSQVNGMYWQEWIYPDKGITLLMESETAESKRNVAHIRLTRPSLMQTSRHIGIGAAPGVIQKAYAGLINTAESSRESIVAGSMYSGVIFIIENDKVSEIFIGAAAE